MTVVWPAIVLPVDGEDGSIASDEEDDVDVRSAYSYGSETNARSSNPARPGRDDVETTPLLENPTGLTGRASALTARLPGFHNTFLPGLVALFIAFVPPLKRNLAEPSGWVWKVIGGSIGWIGMTYIILDTLAIGASLKQAELSKRRVLSCQSCRVRPADRQWLVNRDKKALPPTLGSVLLVCAWRYFALPAISIAIVHGMRKHLPVKAFIHDPVFVSMAIMSASFE